MQPVCGDAHGLGPWHPWVDTKTGSIPLSPAGIAATIRLTSLYGVLQEVRDLATEKEINTAVFSALSGWLKRELRPDAEEFTSEVLKILLGEIKEYEFLARLEGLSLEDQDSLQLGSLPGCRVRLEQGQERISISLSRRRWQLVPLRSSEP
jgi:hypothetical protein